MALTNTQAATQSGWGWVTRLCSALSASRRCQSLHRAIATGQQRIRLPFEAECGLCSCARLAASSQPSPCSTPCNTIEVNKPTSGGLVLYQIRNRRARSEGSRSCVASRLSATANAISVSSVKDPAGSLPEIISRTSASNGLGGANSSGIPSASPQTAPTAHPRIRSCSISFMPPSPR